ncbi:hypothetical protein GCM10027519_42650 [Kineococcus endophyticus]
MRVEQPLPSTSAQVCPNRVRAYRSAPASGARGRAVSFTRASPRAWVRAYPLSIRAPSTAVAVAVAVAVGAAGVELVSEGESVGVGVGEDVGAELVELVELVAVAVGPVLEGLDSVALPGVQPVRAPATVRAPHRAPAAEARRRRGRRRGRGRGRYRGRYRGMRWVLEVGMAATPAVGVDRG